MNIEHKKKCDIVATNILHHISLMSDEMTVGETLIVISDILFNSFGETEAEICDRVANDRSRCYDCGSIYGTCGCL